MSTTTNDVGGLLPGQARLLASLYEHRAGGGEGFATSAISSNLGLPGSIHALVDQGLIEAMVMTDTWRKDNWSLRITERGGTIVRLL
ncbi:MAG: hypothetical protein EOP83_01655, partial [Verrucomicrobiaceae bacterium]